MKWLVRILAIVGATAIAALIAGGVYLGFVVRDGFAARDQPSAMEAHVARAARRMAVPAHAKSLRNPLGAAEDVVSIGRAHWADHCAICHANDGSGHTRIGKNLYPKAPDMRVAATQEVSDGELYYMVQNGIRLSGMPAWGEPGVDDDKESWALVAFMRRLPRLGVDEVEMMEKLNPKSAEENHEEQEEEEFLRGANPR
jgi:mono/diheme cytochrome c family protein